ncbi:MAG: bacteriohemerythrin [Bacteroidales bacterium]|jgi:hemerythrin-like metal-binding protein
MDLIIWHDSLYSVGHQEIDSQHMGLVNTLNELFDKMAKGNGKTILSEIIESLMKYTKEHFRYEEMLMMQYGYPRLKEHKEKHQEFERKVAEFQEKYKKGSEQLTSEVLRFLRDWLTTHIQNTDKDYSSYLK